MHHVWCLCLQLQQQQQQSVTSVLAGRLCGPAYQFCCTSFVLAIAGQEPLTLAPAWHVCCDKRTSGRPALAVAVGTLSAVQALGQTL